jgi:hydrogenase maturation factor HypF (carbamoyltransferase family)
VPSCIGHFELASDTKNSLYQVTDKTVVNQTKKPLSLSFYLVESIKFNAGLREEREELT